MGLFSRLRHRHHHHEQPPPEEESSQCLKDQELVTEDQQRNQQQNQPKKLELDQMLVAVEHPLEPQENILPIKCPPPEPGIVHDGRILKERVAATRRLNSRNRDGGGGGARGHSRGGSLPIEFLPRNHFVPQAAAPPPPSSTVVTSFSAPQSSLITMLS